MIQRLFVFSFFLSFFLSFLPTYCYLIENVRFLLYFPLMCLSPFTALQTCTYLLTYLLNPLNAELNPMCCLLTLLGAHHFLHVSRIRVKSLTLRLLMSYIYIYGAPILDVSRSHTTAHRGFDSHRGHGYLSVASVVCCQVEVSATSWSLLQRSPTDCGASLCVI